MSQENAATDKPEITRGIRAKNAETAMKEIVSALAQERFEDGATYVFIVKGKATRLVLRTLGAVLTIIGLLLLGIGMGRALSSSGSAEWSGYVWPAILGMPLLLVGMALCKRGYSGFFARSGFGKADHFRRSNTVTYLAESTRGDVDTIARAMRESMIAAMSGKEQVVLCPDCKHSNDADAKFCKNCGTPIVR
jgi:hypothetical protein